MELNEHEGLAAENNLPQTSETGANVNASEITTEANDADAQEETPEIEAPDVAEMSRTELAGHLKRLTDNYRAAQIKNWVDAAHRQFRKLTRRAAESRLCGARRCGRRLYTPRRRIRHHGGRSHAQV